MRESVKQRIIGVLVLVALAAVFVPVLFDLEPRQPIATDTRIPPAPDIEPVSIPEPEQVAGIDAPPPAEQAFQPVEPEPAVDPEAGDNSQPVEPPEETAQAATPPPSSTESSAPASGLGEDQRLDAWVVRVGSFSDSDKAEELVARLKQDGYKAYSRNAMSAGRPVVRVFVGPVVSRSEANEHKQAIDRAYRVDALVLEFTP